MEQIVHTLMQIMGKKIDTEHLKKAQRVKYLTYIKPSRIMKNELCHLSAKVEEIAMEKSVNCYDVNNIQATISLQTPVFVNPAFKSVTPLISYVKNINKRLAQKIAKAISPREEKEMNHKLFGGDCHLKDTNSTFSRRKEPTKHTPNYLCKDTQTYEEAKRNGSIKEEEMTNKRENSTKVFSKDLSWLQKRKRRVYACNLSANVTQYTQKKTELNEKYLLFHLKDENFARKNLHITLYISNKGLQNNFSMTKSRSQQVQLLCKQAILSLIKPSKNATVDYQECLLTVTQRHLEDGCKFHFNLPSNYDDYCALLVLNHWAGLLMRHPDSTLMRAISYAIGCKFQEILVLAYSEDGS